MPSAESKLRGVERSLRFLEYHWHRQINVGDVAAASRMSLRGLVKAFLRETGEAPGQVLRGIRIKHAQELLRGTDWPVKVIASVCGFNRFNSFAVAFRRDVGMSPGEYRQRIAQSAARSNEIPLPVNRNSGTPDDPIRCQAAMR